jgi:Ca2+-transporting ATPase
VSSAPAALPTWHAATADAALQALAAGVAGLTSDEAARRLARDGPNALPPPPRNHPLSMLARQFKDFMIGVLAMAAAIALAIGEPVEAAAIVAIVLLNAALGFAQEWRAERAMAALRALAAPRAAALRDGLRCELAADGLVRGDVVLLEAGARVPADVRLLGAAGLRIDESALTGESVPSDKDAAAVLPATTVLAERVNLAYAGTMVSAGRGRALVVATGAATELGRIAGMVASAGELRTPLQERLARFGRRLAVIVLAICALIFASGVLRGESPALMLLTAISLAVAAIPEALPAVVSIALALGAHRMSRAQALVRRLPCVESLGSVTVICSDKTGTLTENRLRVQTLQPANAGVHALALQVLALNSDAVRNAAGRFMGDPTEVALVEAAAAAGLDVDAARAAAPRLAELPFDAGTKRMCTLHATADGALLTMKGAPEAVLGACPAADAVHWHAAAERLAADGQRVLALAARPAAADEPPSQWPQRLAFVGLVGMIDPPREEAAHAVAECRAAGIVPVMITGDHPATAAAVAGALGLPGDAAPLTGAELAALDADGRAGRIGQARVFARVDPAQKIDIVAALQARGEVVAMTGDGVNDAPALRRADVGVAMGRGGTDVAREAADLVLLDDNFATIVAAVREGRRIYDNIRKFIRFVMAGNAGEIWTLFLAPFFGLPLPLTPLQILWVNFVTDGLPGLALTSEPAEADVMRRPPRPRHESVFAHGVWQHILWAGLLIGGVSLAACAWALANGVHPQTMTFTVLTFAQLAHVLAIRSERASLLALGIGSNRPLAGAVALGVLLQLALVYLPPMQAVFGTEPLPAAALAVAGALAVSVAVGVEIEKWAIRRGWLYARTAASSPADAPRV